MKDTYKIAIVSTSLFLFLLTGCAGIIRRDFSHQVIYVTSDSPKVKVSAVYAVVWDQKNKKSCCWVNNRLYCGTIQKGQEFIETPQKIIVENPTYTGRRNYILKFEKEGYVPQEVELKLGTSGWYYLNYLVPVVGWFCGTFLDAFGGAHYTYRPGRIHINLKKNISETDKLQKEAK